MGSVELIENSARIVNYCRTSRRKVQIMTEMNFNDLEVDAYTAILIRQGLLEKNLKEYQTTIQGNSYLDTMDRVKNAFRK
jgi:predicted transcriptional regulator